MIRIPGSIPISIHPVFLAVAALIGWLMSGNIPDTLVIALVIFFSVLWHEIGHASTAVFFGQQAKIAFQALGGMTYREGPKLKLWQEFIIVLNGPLFGLSLFALSVTILAYAGELPHSVNVALKSSTYINLVWTLLNLIPVGPLDGGRLLGIVLEGLFGVRGVRLNFLIGTVLGVAVGTAGIIWNQPILGFLFFMLAFESFRAWQTVRSMTPQDRDEELQQRFGEAEALFNEGEFNRALSAFEEIREKAQEGVLFAASAEYIARILSDQGEFEEAYSLLLPLEKSLGFESLRLLQRLAYYARDSAVVIRVGKQCYQQAPLYDVAFLNALAHALQKEAKEAVGWLKSARREGMPNFSEGLKRRDFDPIREEEVFQALVDNPES